jgi:pyridoxal phosphate enzyme (YggS family)
VTVNNQQLDIAGRIAEVRQRVAEAAWRSGRPAGAVRIVGVTKGVPVPRIEAAMAAGLLDLGENRIQEWLDKRAALGAAPRWHFVGRLQTNKVRYLAQGVALLHSLDRQALAEAVESRWADWRDGLAGRDGAGAAAVPGCLVQVNVAGEDAKAGVAPDELEVFLMRVSGRGIIEVRGLMTIAPYAADAREARWVFARLRALRDSMRPRLPHLCLDELSMGMSGDFDVAIEEGATIVRVGTAIFGPRA